MYEKNNQNSKKIVIAGAGSIGCFLGGMLVNGGENVHFFARPRIGNDLSANGLHLTDWTGINIKLPAEQLNISTDAIVLADADLILICVKSKDSLEMASSILNSGNTNATVFSCQNGVGNVPAIKSVLSNHTVLPIMVPYNVVYEVGGHFHCGTEGQLYCQDHPAARALQNAAVNAKLKFELKTEMMNILWGKLLLNLNNPINALSGLPLKEQLETKAYRDIYVKCLKEGLAVLKAANIVPGKVAPVPVNIIPLILGLPNFLFKRVAQTMLAIDPKARSSMWEDLQSRRPVEVDYITGEIIKLGEKWGVKTPINQRLLELVKQAQDNAQGSPNLSATEISI
ncbi:MAG: 2-dehydropantoate 2-reductase [Crocinitomicaceae bacterium]|jgi:2-dehydropantoate 2-reductase